MIKSEFLDQDDVTSFIGWFAKHLSDASRLGHRYTMPRSRRIEFTNLADALARYEWNFRALEGVCPKGRTLAENGRALEKLKDSLRDAVANGKDTQACEAAINVMKWGGVMNGNADWLREKKEGLATLLRDVSIGLKEDDDDAKVLGAGLRFNAGMTKVYSLLLDNFIIYDSRVAASLAWFVRTGCMKNRPRRSRPT